MILENEFPCSRMKSQLDKLGGKSSSKLTNEIMKIISFDAVINYEEIRWKMSKIRQLWHFLLKMGEKAIVEILMLERFLHCYMKE